MRRTVVLIALGALVVSGCSAIRRACCSIDHDRVAACQAVLGRAPDGSPAAAAKSSLDDQYGEYKLGRMSCDQFRVFFDGAIASHCEGS